MRIYPSRRIMALTFLALLLWFLWEFKNSAKDEFFQLHFDWKNEKVISNHGEVIADSISYNYVQLTLSSPTKPNHQLTQKLSSKNGHFYFRYAFSEIEFNKIVFKGVEWINDQPALQKTQWEYSQTTIPLIQQKGPSIITIGDNILLDNEAKYFRKKISGKLKVNFLGNQTDVFNYKHEAKRNATTQDILENIDSIEIADVYILFLGTQDKNLDKNQIAFNINEIYKKLLNKSPGSRIISILLPTSTDFETSIFNEKFNRIMIEKSTQQEIEIIYTPEIIQTNPEYFMDDGTSLNKKGYEKLAEKVIKMLK